MTVTFLLGTLEFISANFINPYTGEVLEVEGDYFINDTYVNGGTGNADILLGSTHNQFFTIEDSMGNLLLEDLEIFLMAAGNDILLLASDTVVLGDTNIQMAEDNDIVWANVGNDTINGSLGDDILNGGPGNDLLQGDEDEDTLIGWTGDDTLDGGVDNDVLEGGADNDVYMFAPGDGFDVITETSGLDTLRFTDNILLADLTFTQVGVDLQIDVNASGVLSGVTVKDFYAGNPDLTVEIAEFDSGPTFDLLSLLTPVDLGEPDAINDVISNDVSDGIFFGNVMDNDVASPDGGTVVTQVIFGGTTVNVPTDGSNVALTGTNGVLTINNTGAYSYDPFAIGPTVASVFDQFTYSLSDVDGDVDSATLDITTINDSYDLGDPDAINDVVSFNFSDGTTAGNVMGNDVASPDAPTLLVEVTFGGTTVLVPSDGSDVTITGTNGVLTINNLGVYSYDPFAMSPAVVSSIDEFEYTLSDVDGDVDTATLEIITVNDAADVITGTTGDDTLFGGAGNDIIDGNTGSDHLLGGTGDDTLLYSNDAVWPGGFVAWNVGAPDAIINGDRVTVAPRYRSHDNFDGGDGIDTIQMGDDGDALFLDDRYSPNPTGYNTARITDVEIIRAGDGNDIVDLTSKQFSYGDVSIYGDGGDDVLWGNAGDDFIDGGIGDDHLDGASGNDILSGGSGDDLMYGRVGDDTFMIGEGADEVYTGSGADQVVFNMVDSMVDYIRDFSASSGDTLDLSDILVGYDALTDAISDFVVFTESGGSTEISVDADGGADSFVHVATLHCVTGLGDVDTLETNGTLITV